MRRYQKWLAALGIIAVSPGVTLAAGPWPLGQRAQKPAAQAAAADASRASPSSAARPAPNQNQQLAESIAQALRKADRAAYNNINVACQNGVVVLDGKVATPQQKGAVHKIVSQVKGVIRVNSTRLAVQDGAARPPSGVQQASGTQSRQPSGRPTPADRRVRQVATQVEGEAPASGEPVQVPPSEAPDTSMPPPAAPPGIAPRPVAPPPYMPPPAAPPGYGYPGSGQSATVYDQPNYPNYSWPGYAQYPNYAAVTYPKQYSASAWPYIGPFYPYPQVPLGWRQAQLEWDDGNWNLNFRPRTDRWWWFLDYRNW